MDSKKDCCHCKKSKMSIELEIVGEDEKDKWDTLVETSPHGTIFHTWEWLKIMEKHTKSKLYPIVGMKGTTIIGIYPLFCLKNFSLKSVFSPPPWVSVPYLGPVIADYDKLKQDKKESIFTDFQREVDKFIESEIKPNYTLISSPPGLLDARPFKWAGYHVEPIYNYIIDLSKGEDYVWEQFKKNLRQNINRAIREGSRMEEGSKEELEWIINAIARRYEEQGKVASTSIGYLLDLYDTFYPQNMKIFVAKYNDEVVSGMIDIYYKDKVVSWLGNTKANVEGRSPNELLQWEAIKYATENGMKYYEEMGANTERLCGYKSKYNPDLLICFSAKKYSFMAKLAEIVYFKALKPMHARLDTSRA